MHISRYLLNEHAKFISNVSKSFFLGTKTHIFQKKPIFEKYSSCALRINFDDKIRCSRNQTPKMHISRYLLNEHAKFISNVSKTFFSGTKTHIFQKKTIFEKYKSCALRINVDKNPRCSRS